MSIAAIVVVCHLGRSFPPWPLGLIRQSPPEIDRIVRPVVGSEYGAMLYRLYAMVPKCLPKDGLGLIAFPSFHTVMACLCVAHRDLALSRGALHRPRRSTAPGACHTVHGGHNLVDMAERSLCHHCGSPHLASSLRAIVADTLRATERAAAASGRYACAGPVSSAHAQPRANAACSFSALAASTSGCSIWPLCGLSGMPSKRGRMWT